MFLAQPDWREAKKAKESVHYYCYLRWVQILARHSLGSRQGW